MMTSMIFRSSFARSCASVQILKRCYSSQRLSASETASAAQQYLLRGCSPVALGEPTGVFWWDDNTPLYEYSVRNGEKGEGYVLASSSTQLPPVLEYSLTGTPLSVQVSDYFRAVTEERGIMPKNTKLYYNNPLEPIVKYVTDADTEGTFACLPGFVTFKLRESGMQIVRDPVSLFSAEAVASQWESLNDQNSLYTQAMKKELGFCRPVRYQQQCDQYPKSSDPNSLAPGRTYCSPHCISGCTPVAWAMLSSAWKRHGWQGAYDKIWSNSLCWQKEWPTWPSSVNPSRCREVADTIWQFHKHLQTTCEGGTYTSVCFEQGPKFFNQKWGFQWNWGQWNNIGVSKAGQIIEALQPFYFGARGDWQSWSSFVSPSSAPDFVPGKPGHSVLCYGYDTGRSSVLISLGWGSSFGDKWINLASFAENEAYFLSDTSGRVPIKTAPVMQLPPL